MDTACRRAAGDNLQQRLWPELADELGFLDRSSANKEILRNKFKSISHLFKIKFPDFRAANNKVVKAYVIHFSDFLAYSN